ncbi:MAG: beta-ketoacyl-[acyl-carrier-protein] synthase family protein [Planctomycetaceae bacterium]|nr:beta-ketoacyl-[acyl-carrier-protein] synthase family protein [Planctomycetaceae bacterium]
MTAGSGDTRVVISGVGVISPIGTGTEPFWGNLMAGRSGIGYLKSLSTHNLPCKLAAEITDFDPLEHVYNRKFIKVMSRDIQLGVCAASMAMKDAGLRAGDVDPDRLGVEFGAGHIPFSPEDLSDAASKLSSAMSEGADFHWGEEGIGQIAPLWLLGQLPNMPACHVAIEQDARGPNNTITSADASALLALQEALRVIQSGRADVMIVGACSSAIHPVDIARRALIEDLSRRQDDPTRACRPFDLDRDGTIVGEGAGVFVVERYEHAVARGAELYCEVLSVGAGCDGATGSGGIGLVRAMQAAVKRAGIEPNEIGHINAHGKSTQKDDWLEARSYHAALGSDAERIPVIALKSYFGAFEAGSGAVELAGSVLSLKHGELPMSLNYERPDPLCRLNVVHDHPLRLRNRAAMSVNRTALGQSAAAILRAV